MIFDQAEFDLRCEWGEAGVLQLAPRLGLFPLGSAGKMEVYGLLGKIGLVQERF